MARTRKGPSPIRGGSETAKAAGKVGVVIYFTQAERRQVGAAAQLSGQPVAHFVRDQALAAIPKNILKSS